MELSYKEIRAQICDVCHKMWQLGWVASNDGNVSVKLSDGTFLATPTGVSKSMVTPESRRDDRNCGWVPPVVRNEDAFQML